MKNIHREPRSAMAANAVQVAVGGLVFAFSQLVLIFVLTVSGSKIEGGRFAWALAITAPIFLLSNLGLRDSQTAAHPYSGVTTYLRIRAVSASIASVVSALTVVVFASDAGTRYVGFAVIAMKVPEAFSDVYYGAFQRQELLTRTSWSLVLRGIVGAMAGVGCFLVTDSTVASVLSVGVVWLAVVILYDRRVPLTIELYEETGTVPRPVTLAFRSAPLGVAAAVKSLIANVPRLMVEAAIGTAALGALAPFTYISRLHQLVAGGIGQATMSRLAKYHRTGQTQAFRQLLASILAAGVALGLVAIAVVVPLGTLLMKTTFGDEFDRPRLLALLVASTTILTVRSLLGRGIIASSRFAIYMASDLFTLAAVVSLAALWIPAFGIEGFALALCVGYSLGVVLNVVILYTIMLTASGSRTSPLDPSTVNS